MGPKNKKNAMRFFQISSLLHEGGTSDAATRHLVPFYAIAAEQFVAWKELLTRFTTDYFGTPLA